MFKSWAPACLESRHDWLSLFWDKFVQLKDADREEVASLEPGIKAMEPVWVACKTWEWPEGGEAATFFEGTPDSLRDKQALVQMQSELCLWLC